MDLLAMKNEYYSWAFHRNFLGILAILLQIQLRIIYIK